MTARLPNASAIVRRSGERLLLARLLLPNK